MKESYRILLLTLSLLVAADPAFSMDKSEAQTAWDEVSRTLIKSLDGKPTQTFLLKQKITESGNCYGINGKELSAEKCDSIFSDVTDLLSLKSSKSKQDYLSLKSKIESASDVTKENLSPFLSELTKKVDLKLANFESKEKRSDQTEVSKECQIYRMTVDLCRMTSIDESAKAATEHETDVTKESGIVNKYSRYKIGQMKVLHGTKDIPAFRTKYKSLTGKDWSQSACEISEEQEKAAARGTFDPTQEEIDKCGCSKDPNSQNQCSP